MEHGTRQVIKAGWLAARLTPQRLRLSPIPTRRQREERGFAWGLRFGWHQQRAPPAQGREGGDANLSAVCACLSTIGGGRAGRTGKRLALLRSGSETSVQARTFARWAQIASEIYCLPIGD